MNAVFAIGAPAKNPAITKIVTTAALAICHGWRRILAGSSVLKKAVENSVRWRRAMRQKVKSSAAPAIGERRIANCAYGMREATPIIMFCGLPVKVATLPAFEAIATANK